MCLLAGPDPGPGWVGYGRMGQIHDWWDPFGLSSSVVGRHVWGLYEFRK